MSRSRSRPLTKAHRPLVVLALAGLLSPPPFVRAEGDAAPGAAGEKGLAEWTLEGPLPKAVKPITKASPLSDQSNSGGWVLNEQRSDEFDNDSLDAERWTPRHRSWRGRAPALFAEKNVTVADGCLQLWMRKDGAPPSEDGAGFHTYTSAAVQANEESLYGYYEVRAKPMDSAGSSSFWFAGQTRDLRTEIDVFEIGGKAVGHEHRFNMNLHVFYAPGDRRHRNWGGVWKAPFRLADDFHVYGLAWTPEKITYYVDGSEVRRVENKYWHQPIFLIFDSETMPEWLGMPEDDDLPSVFEIDYVRVWDQPPDGRTAAQPLTGPKAF